MVTYISGEGTLITVERVHVSEHLNPVEQQDGGVQVHPVKKEEPEGKYETHQTRM